MATIQVRDIPDDVHERLSRAASQAGQSLQAYMRHLVLDVVETQDRKAAAIRRMEEYLERDGGLGLTAAEIVDAVHAERR
ncbi:MAG: antitoxin [Pseudonocardia sp.]|nr:antitoxin [Pseudonocardia sp.]